MIYCQDENEEDLLPGRNITEANSTIRSRARRRQQRQGARELDSDEDETNDQKKKIADTDEELAHNPDQQGGDLDEVSTVILLVSQQLSHKSYGVHLDVRSGWERQRYWLAQ